MARIKKISDEAVLTIILDIITRIGAAQFSLEDLSRQTKLSPATLIQRFGSKKEILNKALELANKKLAEKLDSNNALAETSIQQIITTYLDLSLVFVKPEDVANGLDILKLDIIEKKLNQITREYFEIRRKKIKSLLDLAIKNGELPKIISTGNLVWDMEALWQGAILQWALIGNGSLHDWLRKRLLSFLRGLGALLP
ncbi:TetR/AcrR family transcriptional regulator [Legionella micdadei]|uniref:Transcriptional regulator, TetR family n=1 Tax=Legionella micdadei TaxID=451 RepID=A0A098GGX2_LEGMI|nr:TetR/AcrR family transcriptional regulator [Legionella micdadei]KTD26544.1 hypothetical protein Lmic_2638 [Legionella micdadei]CEG61738.1 protein of unknown function [Legionella micdadei]SCY22033.1 transcriptional regulator, TetR family [Legionella micdadei]